MENELCIWLSPEDRARLEGWVAGRNTPQKLVWRARIVLMWAQGAGVRETVRATGKTKRTVDRWRERYLARGAAGLERDATRPGRKPPLDAATVERVVNKTLDEKSLGGTHGSLRKMAMWSGSTHRARSAFSWAWPTAKMPAPVQSASSVRRPTRQLALVDRLTGVEKQFVDQETHRVYNDP